MISYKSTTDKMNCVKNNLSKKVLFLTTPNIILNNLLYTAIITTFLFLLFSTNQSNNVLQYD